MDTETRDKLNELIKDARIGMLTTMTADGKHHSRPMALQEAEFDGDLWFFTFEGSNKITDIQVNPEVNISFSKKSDSWVSVTGRAEVVHDHQKADELWNEVLIAWFPDGVDTKGLTLIKVHADSAEYWDTPGNLAVNLFGAAKAKITGKQADGGENKSVDL